MNEDSSISSTPLPKSLMNDSPEPEAQEKTQVKFSIVEKWKEIMSSIKEKTGIDGIYVIIFLSICVLFVYLGIFGSLITSLVGTLYPGFSTIKAIQQKKKKKEWLTYWVVFGTFLIFDMFSNIIMKIIPFYFVLKILFLIWMFIPGSNGCRLVYDFLITKVMSPIEGIFDKFFEGYREVNKDIINKAKKQGDRLMKDIMKLKNKMKQREELKNNENKENNIGNGSNNPNSKSVLDPSVNSKTLINQEKNQEIEKTKQEHINEEIEKTNQEHIKEEMEKTRQEHINLNKDIDDLKQTLVGEAEDEKNDEEKKEINLSFTEE